MALNSAWSPLNQLFFCVFSDFPLISSTSFQKTTISSLCAVCGICRTCSTSWSPYVPDEFSYPWSCCNCGSCIPYIPMWFLYAQLPPRFLLRAPSKILPSRPVQQKIPRCPLDLLHVADGCEAIKFRHKKKTYFHSHGNCNTWNAGKSSLFFRFPYKSLLITGLCTPMLFLRFSWDHLI